jgi:HAD superfamily hydrolase (TIGR01509 family)
MRIMIRAILFDCFGVLVGKGFDETYRSVGGDPDVDRDFVSGLLAQANLGLISQSDFHVQVEHKLDISERVWKDAQIRSEQPDQELLDYITDLHQCFKIAILSNANRGVVQNKLGKECLNNCFDAVIVSAEVGRVKPEQEIYEYAAKSLGVEPEECIFLDDLEGYVRAAERVGMHGIVYRNLTQAKSEIEALIA